MLSQGWHCCIAGTNSLCLVDMGLQNACVDKALQNPKCGCKGTITTKLPFLGLAAWRLWANSTLGNAEALEHRVLKPLFLQPPLDFPEREKTISEQQSCVKYLPSPLTETARNCKST